MKTLGSLLDDMFPGDAARGLPRFSALGFTTGSEPAEALGLAPDVLATLVNALAEVGPAEDGDVNTTLKALRKTIPGVAQTFTTAALETYLSAPAVVRILRGGPAILFPNPRSLPEIDYDLLAPVFERTEKER